MHIFNISPSCVLLKKKAIKEPRRSTLLKVFFQPVNGDINANLPGPDLDSEEPIVMYVLVEVTNMEPETGILL